MRLEGGIRLFFLNGGSTIFGLVENFRGIYAPPSPPGDAPDESANAMPLMTPIRLKSHPEYVEAEQEKKRQCTASVKANGSLVLSRYLAGSQPMQ